MRKNFKQWLANKSLLTALVLALAVVVSPFAQAADISPERQKALIHQLIQDCGSCHGLTMKGGLGPALRPQDLEDKDSESLADIILEGVPGTPMPPWDFEISPGEALWLVKIMKEGTFNAQ